MHTKIHPASHVQIGWVIAADVRDPHILQAYKVASERLQTTLTEQFPQFVWEVVYVHRHRYAPKGALNPLPLLELGTQEKIHNGWDYALVVVPNDLEPRDRILTIGVPSSALETAVLSSAHLGHAGQLADRLVGLALHLLGHLWGLEHETEGPMHPPENPTDLTITQFPAPQKTIVIDRLEEVADKRLEEQSQQWHWIIFQWRAFRADSRSILVDILGYSPWLLPFQMGRLTAATAVSLVFLLLAAESWEIGVNIPPTGLLMGTIIAILLATFFIFTGQNLGQISREIGWREQLSRTRIVVFGTLLLGMVALWFVLFVVSFLVASILPNGIVAGWVGQNKLDSRLLINHAAFMAIIGVLAGALGGNLEDEDEIKAELFYDEET
ncbi:MAG: hypothetical protein D6706_00715 [Chloroflexi bacterium]|nr:MAG: hypothetical protein D6706_00715 [Chloroflexota bacterium]